MPPGPGRDETDAVLEEGGRSAQEQRTPGITHVMQTYGQQHTHSTSQTGRHSKFLTAAVGGDGGDHAQYYTLLASKRRLN